MSEAWIYLYFLQLCKTDLTENLESYQFVCTIVSNKNVRFDIKRS